MTPTRSLRSGRGLAGLDLQAHERALRPADQRHDVVEAPAHDVHHLARLALAHRDDAVGRLEIAALLRGAAGDDLHDRHVVVDHLQRCADALVGQAHLDAVFLGLARLGPGLAGEHQRDRVVLDPLAPQLVELGAVLGPGGLAPVELEALVQREVGFLVEHRARELHALAAARLVAVEDLERRLEPAAGDGVVELVAVAFELRDIGRQEVAARAVQ